jgi:hypothetical protein
MYCHRLHRHLTNIEIKTTAMTNSCELELTSTKLTQKRNYRNQQKIVFRIMQLLITLAC